MSDTIATARRVLELSEAMRRTLKKHTTILEYEAAAEEWGRIMASGWPEEIAIDHLRMARDLADSLAKVNSNG